MTFLKSVWNYIKAFVNEYPIASAAIIGGLVGLALGAIFF